MTVRRNSWRRANDPTALASRLPQELRSFDRWHYPNGLAEYMTGLSEFVGDHQRVTPVMNAAGLSVAEWFKQLLMSPTLPDPRQVPRPSTSCDQR